MGQAAHLANYASPSLSAECEVVAIAELRPKLAREVAARYGIPRVYESADELLVKEKLDGIVAPQRFEYHGSIIPPLYKSRIPVLTEKPIASSVAAGEKMLTALQAAGGWHMVGYHKRSDPATMYAKAEIDRLKQSGELGKLRYIRITMPAGDWIAGGFNGLIRSEEKVPETERDTQEDWGSPYFDFVNYYIHQVNLLRHLFGESYKVKFADKAGSLFVAESASGVTGTIELYPYKTELGWDEAALVGFDGGYVKIELPAPLVTNLPGRVEIRTAKGTFSPILPPVHAMRQQAINFLRAIKGEIKPLCDATEALQDLLIARDYIHLLEGN